MSLKRKISHLHKNNQSQVDNAYLPEALILMKQWNKCKPVPLEFYQMFSKDAWSIACNLEGVYQIITHELVDFIAHLIKGKNSIEICCGVGTLGRALNIPIIDRKVHEDPRASDYYQLHEMAGVKCNIAYPPDVINMTANAAFKEYQPDWVIGCWVTQKLVAGRIGMMFGPTEEPFVEKANYIHIGTSHLDIHTKKTC